MWKFAAAGFAVFFLVSASLTASAYDDYDPARASVTVSATVENTHPDGTPFLTRNDEGNHEFSVKMGRYTVTLQEIPPRGVLLAFIRTGGPGMMAFSKSVTPDHDNARDTVQRLFLEDPIFEDLLKILVDGYTSDAFDEGWEYNPATSLWLENLQ